MEGGALIFDPRVPYPGKLLGTIIKTNRMLHIIQEPEKYLSGTGIIINSYWIMDLREKRWWGIFSAVRRNMASIFIHFIFFCGGLVC
jgi:hypothetical protein